MANYTVNPDLLLPYMPPLTEPDSFNGQYYISLVGFLFRNVKIRGLSIPWHRHFPEVNLRFYVRHFDGNQWKRGVVFISEIVPKPAITLVANTLYREHYSTLPMQYNWETRVGLLHTGYQWKKNKKWNQIGVVTGLQPEPLQSGSEAEFITEHFHGYTRYGKHTAAYEVAHPRWDIYPVQSYTVDCDFTGVYGSPFAFLQQREPASVFLAEGSAISVSGKQVLRSVDPG